MDQVVAENGFRKAELLSAVNDEHGGVIVELKEHMDPNVFLTLLRASILQWKLQGKSGVWIKLPFGLVNLVEVAVKEGFWYHHAEPHYLMLVYWIPETANTIPANATHRVGIGAIVLNDKRELLVVQEKSGRFQGSGVWKIPTGVVDEGEDIFDAATREVKEETGIDTEFTEILAFRQHHKWMPFDEYAAQPFAQKHSLYQYIAELCLAKVDRGYAGFTAKPITSVFSDQLSYLYLNNQDLNQQSSASRS